MRFAPILALAATAFAATHLVELGEGGELLFVPSTVTAAVGDLIEFKFYPNNHSVVQGNFDSPCQPRDGGFYSGFYFATHGGPAANAFVIEVTTPDPVYMYCSQASHCSNGMVFILNPSEDHPFSAYAAAAATASLISSPSTTLRGGSVLPTASITASESDESSTSGSESATTTTGTSTSTGTDTTATSTSTSTSTSSSASGNGAPMMTQAAKVVAGIAGAVAMLAL